VGGVGICAAGGMGAGIGVGIETGAGAVVFGSKAAIGLGVVCLTLNWVEMGGCVAVR
jgi:hypothetical protein